MPGPASAPRAEIVLEIPFHDLDPMGVVWHGHYVRYFELARCALLERAGYNYQHMAREGFMWPVTALDVQYRRSLVFRQRVRVSAAATAWASRLELAYAIHDLAEGWLAARATSTQVAVRVATGELVFPSPPGVVAAFARLARGAADGDAAETGVGAGVADAATAGNECGAGVTPPRPWPRWSPPA